ncbi:hypothetical protein NQ318_004311 [Aromia moschata]|uniref:ribonuclease H n=1 Tax=Aromia moschata TaxID=1265417 RepID=A0AAV8YRD2_9CUCU|nr:hypothetical protein NQ318_004311 [Aromia moschata]
MENGYVKVYTDGACENNGRSNARAGIGVWFATAIPWSYSNISEPVQGRPTNNHAEIKACTEALNTIRENGDKNQR